MVLLLPPAPAARVLLGRALATLSALSAAALRRITVLGPPGGVGVIGRAALEPEAEAELIGELGRGEDCNYKEGSADWSITGRKAFKNVNGESGSGSFGVVVNPGGRSGKAMASLQSLSMKMSSDACRYVQTLMMG